MLFRSKPPYGVYFGIVEYKGSQYKALINWGVKPTIDNNLQPILEAHILDFNKEIYGEKIRVFFKKPLREEKKFNNIQELKNAIINDIKSISQE